MTVAGADYIFSALDRLGQLADPGDLVPFLRDVAGAYHLDHVAYLAPFIPQVAERAPYHAVTYPAAWVEQYKAQSYLRIDPVLRDIGRSVLPMDWGSFDRRSKTVRQLFGEAAEFGIGPNGLTIPIRGHLGDHAVLSVASSATRRDWEAQRDRLSHDLQVLAYHVHHSVLRLHAVVARPVALSPRELDCLQWSARGKTVPEIGLIHGISERTTRFYLDIARHKLGCTNITHAVARAIASGLIYAG